MQISEGRRGPAAPPLVGLPPLLNSGSRLLLLGSFPSRLSLEAGRYYANPRNHFWRLLATLAAEARGEAVEGPAAAPEGWEGRLALLAELGLSLWDLVASCRREGSLDSEIREAELNDLPGLLAARPSIRGLLLNGGAAASLLLRFLEPGAAGKGLEIGRTRVLSLAGRELLVQRLPSSSPIPTAGYPDARSKLDVWRGAFRLGAADSSLAAVPDRQRRGSEPPKGRRS